MSELKDYFKDRFEALIQLFRQPGGELVEFSLERGKYRCVVHKDCPELGICLEVHPDEYVSIWLFSCRYMENTTLEQRAKWVIEDRRELYKLQFCYQDNNPWPLFQTLYEKEGSDTDWGVKFLEAQHLLLGEFIKLTTEFRGICRDAEKIARINSFPRAEDCYIPQKVDSQEGEFKVRATVEPRSIFKESSLVCFPLLEKALSDLKSAKIIHPIDLVIPLSKAQATLIGISLANFIHGLQDFPGVESILLSPAAFSISYQKGASHNFELIVQCLAEAYGYKSYELIG